MENTWYDISSSGRQCSTYNVIGGGAGSFRMGKYDYDIISFDSSSYVQSFMYYLLMIVNFSLLFLS